MPETLTTTDRREAGRAGTAALTAFCGVFMLLAGIWTPAGPGGVPGADGAFQVGLGIGLLLSLAWRDALATALVAFLVANTAHAFTLAASAHTTGEVAVPWLLGVLSALVAIAFWARMRQLGYVMGRPLSATTPALVPFVEQKTVLLTTYRKNGTAVATPVSIAVDGNRAVVRGFQKAGKTRRLRNDPNITVAPCTSRGAPTGPALRATARLLDGGESRRAALLLRRKYPLLHGVLVPLAHRAGRAKTGHTVHFELIPEGVS